MGFSRPLGTEPPDVYITEELEKRAPATPDYLKEKRAIQALAATMANSPSEVLPHFVDLAMQLTGGVSAGLSLFEADPVPGIFRWQYLRGVLSPFDGATTPRNFSPCGITLDQNRPVLSLHPERIYGWISDANIVVPEVLLVPLYIDGLAPSGTLWIVSGVEGHFNSDHARIAGELAAFVGIALQMVRTQKKLAAALEKQETLAREMGHRVKNVFALIAGMIRTSARSAVTKDGLAEVLAGRVHALANAHTLVRRSFSSGDAPAEVADVEELIRAVIRPHQATPDDVGPFRFTISGPTLACQERAANGLALLVHELATNAAKYGALSNDDGGVAVRWWLDGHRLRLERKETGGPTISCPPQRQGFGTKLAVMTVERQFAGDVDFQWAAAGLTVAIDIPAAALLT